MKNKILTKKNNDKLLTKKNINTQTHIYIYFPLFKKTKKTKPNPKNITFKTKFILHTTYPTKILTYFNYYTLISIRKIN